MESIKELFDLVHQKSEGIYGKVHIIELDTYYDCEEQEFYSHVYRIYHADGYCFEVSRFSMELFESEDDEVIDGYSYRFNSDMFEGFKEIKDAEHAICLIKNHLI